MKPLLINDKVVVLKRTHLGTTAGLQVDRWQLVPTMYYLPASEVYYAYLVGDCLESRLAPLRLTRRFGA